MKIAIYTRVASFHPHDHEAGHARQEAECREFAEARGWQLVDVYCDTGVSRGERNRMLQDGMDGDFEGIVCWDTTRLGRKPGDLEEVLDSDLRLVTADGRFDSRRPADAFVARMTAGLNPSQPVPAGGYGGDPVPLF